MDEEENNYCGLKLNWNYENEYVDVSISNFLDKTLKNIQHSRKMTQHASPRWVPPSYDKKQQITPPPFVSEKSSPEESKVIENIVGSFFAMDE